MTVKVKVIIPETISEMHMDQHHSGHSEMWGWITGWRGQQRCHVAIGFSVRKTETQGN